MPRRKTVEEMLQEAEAGKSGGTLGEAEARQRQEVETDAERKDREERERRRKRGEPEPEGGILEGGLGRLRTILGLGARGRD